MKAYVERTWGWDEAWQQEHFRRNFDPDACRIITVEGEDAGVLSLEIREEEVFLRNIEIMPEHQRKGIGTFLIDSVLGEARGEGKNVVLQVLKVNPARRLYERLGFSITGENATHYLMKTGNP